MTESTLTPLSGLYQPNHLSSMYYGPGSVATHLLSCLPSEQKSRAFIITGTSLATKTPLITQIEKLLGPDRHAGTFSKIGQHAPVKELDEATELVKGDESIDTIISVGGGSPIDSAKAIVYRVHEEKGRWLAHVAVPTTLSAAEVTFIAGYTTPEGVKTSLADPHLHPTSIIYDATFAQHTPPNLILTTAIRALDHAVELTYHPYASETCRAACRSAVHDLFTYLPQYKANPKDNDTLTRLQLAAFNSLAFLGRNIGKSGLGLSHTFGYALGSPYGIPHGVTSCLTLGHVVKFKVRQSPEGAERCAGLLPLTVDGSGKAGERSGDDVKDGIAVGDAILDLVSRLGLSATLSQYQVGRDQVGVICKRATGGKEEEGSEIYEAVKGIVLELF